MINCKWLIINNLHPRLARFAKSGVLIEIGHNRVLEIFMVDRMAYRIFVCLSIYWLRSHYKKNTVLLELELLSLSLKIMLKLILKLTVLSLTPFVLLGQNITVEYKHKLMVIDSVVLYNYDGERVGLYSQFTQNELTEKMFITVVYKEKHKLCLPISYHQILCDSVMVSLRYIPNKCKYAHKTIGSFQTCQGMSHSISFLSNYAPCFICKRKLKRHLDFK